MGYKDIRAGEKTAKPIAARFITAKTGSVGLEVSFEFEESGNKEKMTWVGWLSSAAMERTMDTLVNVLGFNGNDTCDDNCVLSDPNALAWDKAVKLVVDIESYEGKSYPKIKWVNPIVGSAYSGCSPSVIKASVGDSIKAAFLAAKQGSSVNVPF